MGLTRGYMDMGWDHPMSDEEQNDWDDDTMRAAEHGVREVSNNYGMREAILRESSDLVGVVEMLLDRLLFKDREVRELVELVEEERRMRHVQTDKLREELREAREENKRLGEREKVAREKLRQLNLEWEEAAWD